MNNCKDIRITIFFTIATLQMRMRRTWCLTLALLLIAPLIITPSAFAQGRNPNPLQPPLPPGTPDPYPLADYLEKRGVFYTWGENNFSDWVKIYSGEPNCVGVFASVPDNFPYTFPSGEKIKGIMWVQDPASKITVHHEFFHYIDWATDPRKFNCQSKFDAETFVNDHMINGPFWDSYSAGDQLAEINYYESYYLNPEIARQEKEYLKALEAEQLKGMCMRAAVDDLAGQSPNTLGDFGGSILPPDVGGDIETPVLPDPIGVGGEAGPGRKRPKPRGPRSSSGGRGGVKKPCPPGELPDAKKPPKGSGGMLDDLWDLIKRAH